MCVCVCVCVCVCATVVDKVTVDRALSIGAAERGLVPVASLQEKNAAPLELLLAPPLLAHPTPPRHHRIKQLYTPLGLLTSLPPSLPARLYHHLPAMSALA